MSDPAAGAHLYVDGPSMVTIDAGRGAVQTGWEMGRMEPIRRLCGLLGGL